MPASTEASERVLALLALLLSSRRPVPRAEIYDSLADYYTGSDEARERRFTRDKNALQSLGVRIEWIAGGEDEEEGYRIDRSSFFLPDVAFTPAERASLYAVGAAAMASAFPFRAELGRALAKLRSGVEGEVERVPATLYTAAGSAGPREELVYRAVADRRRLKLVYPPEQQERLVEPYAAAGRRGRTAVVGFCHLRGAIRTFYTDRMTSCELAAPKARAPEFDLPADFDARAHLPLHPWQIRTHPPLEVELAFSPALAEAGPRALGFPPGERAQVTFLDGLINQVLALGGGATIRGPASARERMRERLAEIRRRQQEAR